MAQVLARWRRRVYGMKIKLRDTATILWLVGSGYLFIAGFMLPMTLYPSVPIEVGLLLMFLGYLSGIAWFWVMKGKQSRGPEMWWQ